MWSFLPFVFFVSAHLYCRTVQIRSWCTLLVSWRTFLFGRGSCKGDNLCLKNPVRVISNTWRLLNIHITWTKVIEILPSYRLKSLLTKYGFEKPGKCGTSLKQFAGWSVVSNSAFERKNEPAPTKAPGFFTLVKVFHINLFYHLKFSLPSSCEQCLLPGCRLRSEIFRVI